MTWPNDADGNAFRTLEEDGFDFSKAYLIGFNVDFEKWPPSTEAIKLLKEKYNNIEVIEPTEEFDGYIEIQLSAKLSYEFVIEIQKEVTDMMKKYAGSCESWEVMNGDKA